MAESMEAENAAFWLPKHFLTDDDFLSSNNNDSSGFGSGFGSDPFDSPVSSTDNDENNNIINDDDVSLLSHLTRHLARTSLHDSKHSSSDRSWVYSTSPQSTLTGFGTGWSSTNRSPSGPSRVPSPPLTPELQNDAAWDLLYEAAGQVARLKMNAIAAQLTNNGGLLGPPRHSCGGGGFTPANNNKSPHLHTLYNKQYEDLNWAHNCGNHHQQRRSCGGAMGLPQTAWPPLATRQPHNHSRQTSGAHMRGLYQQGGGATRTVGPTMGGGVKRQSAGTGVFLPRRVTTSPPRHHHQHTEVSRKQTVVVPTRVNMDVVEEANLKPHLRFGGAGFTDHDLMMARRNVILGQQRRNLIARNEGNNATAMVGQGHEIRLPSDWTY